MLPVRSILFLSLIGSALALGALIGPASARGDRDGKADPLTTRELIIVDETGKRRIRLGVGDIEGKRSGPFVEILGTDEKPRIQIALVDENKRFIAFRDAAANYEMMLQFAEERFPSLVLFGENDSKIALGIGPGGRSNMTLEGGATEGKRSTAEVTLIPTHALMMNVSDFKGRPRLDLISKWKGGTELKFLDPAGKSKWAAP